MARLKAARLKHAPWKAGLKPVFHGACFGAVSAPTLSARVPRRARATFEKERFHYEHSSCFHGADCRADYCPRRQSMLPDALIVRLPSQKTRGNSDFSLRLALLFDAKSARIFQ